MLAKVFRDAAEIFTRLAETAEAHIQPVTTSGKLRYNSEE
jgi:hypothetical protein